MAGLGEPVIAAVRARRSPSPALSHRYALKAPALAAGRRRCHPQGAPCPTPNDCSGLTAETVGDSRSRLWLSNTPRWLAAEREWDLFATTSSALRKVRSSASASASAAASSTSAGAPET